MKGTVKWFDSKVGYGFITDSKGKDVFVYHQNIQMDGFRTLHEDDMVEFELSPESKNREQEAINVIPVFTLKMIEKALEKDNLYVKPIINEFGEKGYMVVDQNNVPKTSDYGMTFDELSAYARLAVISDPNGRKKSNNSQYF